MDVAVAQRAGQTQLLEMAVACRSGQLTDQPSTGSPAAVTTSWATSNAVVSLATPAPTTG
jgi:hypothetical protein